jgi:hypothetical protein
MPRTLLPPGSPNRDTTSPASGHVEDRAVLDFLRGEYLPVGAHRPQRTDPAPAPPVAGALAYCADIRPAYAIVQYDGASRVHWAFGMFGDALSAEQYAIDADLTRYDVVSATPVVRGPS